MKNVRFLVALPALFVLASPAGAAVVKGQVNFEGTPPVMEKLKMNSDPQCAMQHPQGHESEEVVLNPNGTLKNAFVYVKEGVTAKHDAPKTPVIFDQKGCRYEPRVFGIQAGQPLQILNSDATLHNVHALPSKSQQFNLGMPIKGMKLTKSFASPEVMVKIKCEVHPWMAAYAGVLDHPFYAVSGADGQFEIKDLPPGTYTIEAWHEKFGAQAQSVTVEAADEQKEADFTFKG